jgi:hypothetical protein
MAKPDIKGGGEVLFTSIKLYSPQIKTLDVAIKSDEYVDLQSVYVNLSVFESILTPFITAELTVKDSNNLIADYPILGGEIVRVTYNVPGGDDSTKVTLNMRVTAIKNVLISERKQLFTIQLISYEGFKNLNSTISKSFNGDGTSIVQQIFGNYLFEKKTGKVLNVDPSKGSMKVVCPRWTPYKAINFVQHKTLGINSHANFFFYETLKDFYFLSTDTLFDRNANVCITDKFNESQGERPEGKLKSGYHYKIPGIPVIGDDGKPKSGMTGDESYQNVDAFRVDARQQIGKDIKEGFLYSKQITHDLYHKNYSVEEYNYYRDFNKYKRLAKSHKYSQPGVPQNQDVKIFLSSKSTNLHEGYRNTFADQYGLDRRIVVKQMQDEVISNFQVPGHPIVGAGRLLEFNFPSIKSVTKPEDVYEKKYQGLYLVRDCVHIFVPVNTEGRATYKCDTNIVKDGFNA